MGDPVSTAVIAEAAAPTISELAGAGAIVNPFTSAMTTGMTAGMTAGSTAPFSMGSVLNGYGTNLMAGGDPAKGLAMNAAALAGSGGYGAGGESLFGFDPSISGVGQGIMESLGSANKFINANPVTSQIGLSLAKNALTPQQTHYVQAGQIQRGQFQPVDYMSLLNPQGQSGMRQQPISLL
jgi:hypothetical protein